MLTVELIFLVYLLVAVTVEEITGEQNTEMNNPENSKLNLTEADNRVSDKPGDKESTNERNKGPTRSQQFDRCKELCSFIHHNSYDTLIGRREACCPVFVWVSCAYDCWLLNRFVGNGPLNLPDIDTLDSRMNQSLEQKWTEFRSIPSTFHCRHSIDAAISQISRLLCLNNTPWCKPTGSKLSIYQATLSGLGTILAVTITIIFVAILFAAIRSLMLNDEQKVRAFDKINIKRKLRKIKRLRQFKNHLSNHTKQQKSTS